MKFKDLQVGMKFRCHSEDNDTDYWDGKIVELYKLNEGLVNGFIAVQFDDEVGSWTAGAPEQDIYKFMEPL